MALFTSTDLDAAKAFTDDEDYVFNTPEGYDVVAYNVGRGDGYSAYYSVTHIETGIGLGSYSTLKEIAQVIAEHQEYLAATPAGEVVTSAASPIALAEDAKERTSNGDDAVQPETAPAQEAPVEAEPQAQQVNLV